MTEWGNPPDQREATTAGQVDREDEMRENYEDIKALTKKSPQWYDANGTPRYAKFHPTLCPDIYSNTVILMDITCQQCGKHFTVEMHSGLWETSAPPKKWHYGDPPIHGCVGDTMNCDDVSVLEVWRREHMEEWERVPELEGNID